MANAKIIMFEPSTLELIDKAMINFINEMNIYATTNKGWKKVPTIWVSAERAYHVKRKKELRDAAGAVILPLVTLDRISASKDSTKAPWGNVPSYGDEKGGSIVVGKRIKQDKTSNFLNADSFRKYGTLSTATVGVGQFNFPFKNPGKVVYETISRTKKILSLAN